jgi:hypothetical protein
VSYFTIFKRGEAADGTEAWLLVAGTVEAEDPDEALEQVLNAPGAYMLVEVKALREVKAKTTYTVEPMNPPEEVVLTEELTISEEGSIS